VSYYFQRRRAFATGVAVCGAGVGCFVFAPLCKLLLSVYAWKSAMLIVSGITLNGVVFAALLVPLRPPVHYRRPRSKTFLDRWLEKRQRSRRCSECGEDKPKILQVSCPSSSSSSSIAYMPTIPNLAEFVCFLFQILLF